VGSDVINATGGVMDKSSQDLAGPAGAASKGRSPTPRHEKDMTDLS
jgi:hypothetical protein